MLCEDERFELLKLICESSGWESDEVDFWSYNGCSNHHVASALITHIKKKSPNVIVLIHRDRDYLTDEELESWKNELPQDKNIFVFVTEGNDLEHLFLSKDHLNHLISESTVNLDELLSSSLEACMSKQFSKIVNTRIGALRTLKGKANINEGKEAAECLENLKNHGVQYAHGKILLKSLKNEYQKMTRQNLNVEKATPALSVKMLCNIWNKHLNGETR